MSTSGQTGMRAFVASTAVLASTLVPFASAPPSTAAAVQQECTVRGSANADVLRGTAANDRLCGLGGDDVLLGRAGDDIVDGGGGDDVLLGGPGDDTLLGGPGDDLLVDPVGGGVLDGGPGQRDRCVGRASTTFRGCETVLPPPRPVSPRPAGASGDRALKATAQPRFDPTRSSVVLRDDAVVVSFEELGLAPGATVEVEVTATRTSTATCADPSTGGAVVLRTTSTAEATETSTYRADGRGRVVGVRTLEAAPGSIEITGYVCRRTERVVVTLRDRANGATLTLSP